MVRDMPDQPSKGDPVQIVVPEKLQLQISIDRIPEPASTLLHNLAKPAAQNKLKTIFKDYLPILTPIATAVIAFCVAYYGGQFEDRSTQETLDRITTEFVEKRGDPNIAAMKLAAYRDKALPAVRMVLASDDDKLRNGGELILETMYVDGTVAHRKLLNEVIHDYDTPTLRRGVLEWLTKMGPELQQCERERALRALTDPKNGFGAQGQNCATQDVETAFAASHLLLVWSSSTSTSLLEKAKDLALGLAENCLDTNDQTKYDHTRETAIGALQLMARIFSKNERQSIVKRLKKLSPAASDELTDRIDNTVMEIEKLEVK